jgi:N-glycosylase/DNA lyase
MNIYESENKIIIENIEYFNLSDTFDCGQCFRFNKTGDIFEGVAFGKYLRIYQADEKIYLETNPEDFNNIWRNFFDIDRDYKKIFETLRQDEILKKASNFCPGIRILRQEPFECLISFIFSQNNNIPRIKKIIGRLCENFGEKIIAGDKIYYTFPNADKIANLTLEDLDVIKSGFRAKYILGAAKKVASGEIDLNSIYKMTASDGAEYLKQIKGVGDKIAACVLLFGYNKLDAFPVDVWIKKAIEKYYPAGFDYKKTFGEYAGIANAYLFYYERENY